MMHTLDLSDLFMMVAKRVPSIMTHCYAYHYFHARTFCNLLVKDLLTYAFLQYSFRTNHHFKGVKHFLTRET